MYWGCCYISVNNSQNPNQSFQNAASSFYDENEMVDLDQDNTFNYKVPNGEESLSANGELSVPMTLEQMD